MSRPKQEEEEALLTQQQQQQQQPSTLPQLPLRPQKKSSCCRKLCYITISITILLIAILAGYAYDRYNRTLFYYPDQNWTLTDTISVWSGDHPNAIIMASPQIPLIMSDFAPVIDSNDKNSHLAYDVYSTQHVFKSQQDRKTTTPDITIKTPLDYPDLAPTDTLFKQLLQVPKWDRRTFLVGFWNYAFYDSRTKMQMVAMYLYQHYPESEAREPQIRVNFAAMTKNGQPITFLDYFIDGKDVLFENNADLYYNTTTWWNNRVGKNLGKVIDTAPGGSKQGFNSNWYQSQYNNTSNVKDLHEGEFYLNDLDPEWSFSHRIDHISNKIMMTAHLPLRFNCHPLHPDRVDPVYDSRFNVYQGVREFGTFYKNNPKRGKVNYVQGTKFDRDGDDGVNTNGGDNNDKNGIGSNANHSSRSSGTYTSTEPIDIDSFVRQHMYNQFIKRYSEEEVNAMEEEMIKEEEEDKNKFIPSSFYRGAIPNDPSMTEEERINALQSNAESSTDLNQIPPHLNDGTTCVSQITFNFTLYPVSQGFGNDDFLKAAPDENVISWGQFVDENLDAYHFNNKTKIAEFEQRKIPEEELDSSCRNGFSFLHGFASVADGFVTISPLTKANSTTKVNRRTGTLYYDQIIPHEDDGVIKGLMGPDGIRNHFHRDYRLEGDCGEITTKRCIKDLPYTARQNDIFVVKNTTQFEFYETMVHSINVLPGYRYAVFHTDTLSTLTPNTITFWSHAPHINVPSLRHYLIQTDQLYGPNAEKISKMVEKCQNDFKNDKNSLNCEENSPQYQSQLAILEEERQWDISNYINRFKWYAGASYGCTLTRGTPNYKYPWAWAVIQHTMSRYDQVYAYGVPARLKPNGEYEVENRYLDEIKDQSIKLMILQEAKRLSFHRDYSHIIKLAQDEEYLTMKSLTPASFIIDPVTMKPLSSQHPIRYTAYSDFNIVFGDARINTGNNLIGNLYGTYCYAKLPNHPQLTTREVILRENNVWQPSHPLLNPSHTPSNYKKSNPTLTKLESADEFIDDHYIKTIPDEIQFKIPKAMTYSSFQREYGLNFNNNTNNNNFSPLSSLSSLPTIASHYLNNLPIARGSSDGHLSLVNITNARWNMYYDSSGSLYLPVDRVITEETRTWWISLSLKLDEFKSEFETKPYFKIRATVPMWKDIGPVKVKELKAIELEKAQVVEYFKFKIEEKINRLKSNDNKTIINLDEIIPTSLQILLLGITQEELGPTIDLTDELVQKLNKITALLRVGSEKLDGEVILYSDLRAHPDLATALIYRKHYVPEVSCDDWYHALGRNLIKITKEQNIDKKKSSSIPSSSQQPPIKCPEPGDYSSTIWCQPYSNNKMTLEYIGNNRSSDSFDRMNTQLFNRKTPLGLANTPSSRPSDICVIYSKHMYIPNVSHGLIEHAYEATLKIDRPLTLSRASALESSSSLVSELYLALFKEMGQVQF